ncbi:tyrosine-protein kinase family protein [Spirochaeta dissipatitropha]
MVHKSLRTQTIGISSGKGGVGKTTTAANMGVYFARRGIPTAILDLDPLSDLATLFDMENPEDAGNKLGPIRTQLAPRLDLLFPKAVYNVHEKSRIVRRFLETHEAELLNRYRILIIDLPAGGGDEENLSLLPYIGQLVLVTNPEPTAHVSAGGYLHMVMERELERQVYIWHNKFSLERAGEFNPRDVVGNYHRNVNEDTWLTDRFITQLHDIAFVPADPSLNLLHAENPNPLSIVFHSARQSVLHILEGWLDADSCPLQELKGRMPQAVVRLVRGCLSRRPGCVEDSDGCQYIIDYIDGVIEAGTSIGDEPGIREPIEELLVKLKADPVWRNGVRALSLLQEISDSSDRLFGSRDSNIRKLLDNTLVKLMYAIALQPDLPRLCRNSAGMLLFQFSAAKLFNIDKVRNLILSLVPHRQNPQGKSVRDRRVQIKRIVEQDEPYRKQYMKLLKTSYPLFTRQIDAVVKTFELNPLLFRDEHEQIYKKAYVTLLSQLIHDILYSGMGIVVGFSYRAASDAFASGADILLEQSKTL